MSWFRPSGAQRAEAPGRPPAGNPAGAPTAVDGALGVVVETIEGGCGGVLREEHAYPSGSRAEVGPSGQLTVLDEQDQVVVQFAGGTWVNWRRGESPGQSRYGSC